MNWKSFIYLGICILTTPLVGCAKPAMLLTAPTDQETVSFPYMKYAPLKATPVTPAGVCGSDRWHSTVMRWLTPNDSNTESFSALFNTTQGSEKLTLEAGKQLRRHSQSEPWWRADQKRAAKTSEIIYAESLFLYLHLPMLEQQLYNVTLLGPATINNTTYKRLFFTLAPGASDNQQIDQYVAYWNEQTQQLDFINFTYRDLYASYQGVFGSLITNSNKGKKYPRQIDIQNHFTSQKMFTACVSMSASAQHHNLYEDGKDAAAMAIVRCDGYRLFW